MSSEDQQDERVGCVAGEEVGEPDRDRAARPRQDQERGAADDEGAGERDDDRRQVQRTTIAAPRRRRSSRAAATTASDAARATPERRRSCVVAAMTAPRLTVAPIGEADAAGQHDRIACAIATSASGNQLWANFAMPPRLRKPGKR